MEQLYAELMGEDEEEVDTFFLLPSEQEGRSDDSILILRITGVDDSLNVWVH